MRRLIPLFLTLALLSGCKRSAPTVPSKSSESARRSDDARGPLIIDRDDDTPGSAPASVPAAGGRPFRPPAPAMPTNTPAPAGRAKRATAPPNPRGPLVVRISGAPLHHI